MACHLEAPLDRWIGFSQVSLCPAVARSIRGNERIVSDRGVAPGSSQQEGAVEEEVGYTPRPGGRRVREEVGPSPEIPDAGEGHGRRSRAAVLRARERLRLGESRGETGSGTVACTARHRAPDGYRGGPAGLVTRDRGVTRSMTRNAARLASLQSHETRRPRQKKRHRQGRSGHRSRSGIRHLRRPPRSQRFDPREEARKRKHVVG